MQVNWNHLFLGFSGRTSKRDFWIGFAVLALAGLAASLVPLVGGIVGLALLYPWSALLTKRLHDFGKSGRLVLIPAVPAAISGVLWLYCTLAMGSSATMGAAFGAAGLMLLVSSVAMLVGLGFLLWAGLKDGESQANRYGVVPVDASLAAAASLPNEGISPVSQSASPVLAPNSGLAGNGQLSATESP